MQISLVLVLSFISSIAAFSTRGFVSRSSMKGFALRMSEEGAPAEASEPEFTPQDPKLFDMNKRVRLGRSRDQDGKSNIWSIEPSMQVEEEPKEGGGVNKNLLVAGLVITAALGALPLFSAFSSLLPDAADF